MSCQFTLGSCAGVRNLCRALVAPFLPLCAMCGNHPASMLRRGHLAGRVPLPDDLVVIGAVEFRVRRVIAPDGFPPRFVRIEQSVEQLRGVSDVGFGVQCALQVIERVGMVFQVDLHASDSDVADALLPELVHMGDRSGLVGKYRPSGPFVTVQGQAKSALFFGFQRPDSTWEMAVRSALGISAPGSTERIACAHIF